MLPSQHKLFDIPEGVCFLDAATCSPLPRLACKLGREAIARKSRPWQITPAFAQEQYSRSRQAAAKLINADPEDVALVSSVAYGVATAAKIMPVRAGSRILVLQDDHSSPVLEWTTRASAEDFVLETVPRPSNGDWTEAVLGAIGRSGAAPISIASISSVHWSDGGLVDLAPVATALRACGAALLVDAPQSVGVLAFDVQLLDPDFVVFPSYKWLLGPFGRSYLYVAKRHQGGTPLEQTNCGRRAVRADQDIYFADVDYVSDARRFDMGQRDLASVEIASVGMEMIIEWGSAAIVERLALLTSRLADGLQARDVSIPRLRVTAPHILSLGFRRGVPNGMVERLAAENIHVAYRLGRLRISPHVYNDVHDIDRMIEAFHRIRNQMTSD